MWSISDCRQPNTRIIGHDSPPKEAQEYEELLSCATVMCSKCTSKYSWWDELTFVFKVIQSLLPKAPEWGNTCSRTHQNARRLVVFGKLEWWRTSTKYKAQMSKMSAIKDGQTLVCQYNMTKNTSIFTFGQNMAPSPPSLSCWATMNTLHGG